MKRIYFSLQNYGFFFWFQQLQYRFSLTPTPCFCCPSTIYYSYHIFDFCGSLVSAAAAVTPYHSHIYVHIENVYPYQIPPHLPPQPSTTFCVVNTFYASIVVVFIIVFVRVCGGHPSASVPHRQKNGPLVAPCTFSVFPPRHLSLCFFFCV